jgi:hypothetical protein
MVHDRTPIGCGALPEGPPVKTLSAASLLAAVLLTAGGVPPAAAQGSPVALAPVLKLDPGTDSPDGHTSRGCSFLFLRWC